MSIQLSTILLILLFTTSSISAQSSVLESSSGEGSLYLKGNEITANFANNEITFKYGHYLSGGDDGSTNRTLDLGLTTSIKSSERVATIFKDGEFSPSLSIEPFVALYFEVSEVSDIVLIPSYTYNISKYDLFTRDYIKVTEFDKNSSLSFAMNFKTSFDVSSEGMDMLVGLAISHGFENNIKQLTKTEIRDYSFNADSTKLITKNTTSAYEFRDLLDKEVIGTKINSDVFLQIPKAQLGGLVYGRYVDSAVDNHKISWGLGMMFTKKDEPEKVIGGLTFEFNDIRNSEKKDRLIINLIVGIPF